MIQHLRASDCKRKTHRSHTSPTLRNNRPIQALRPCYRDAMSDMTCAEIAPIPASPETRGKRFSQSEIALALSLRADGLTLAEISKRLDRPISSVHQVLEHFADRRDLARAYLEGHSLTMARNVVKHGKASDHVRTLQGLAVLAPDASAQVAVVIGPASTPASLTIPTFDADCRPADIKQAGESDQR